MARFGFIGGSYQSQAVNADAQACINFYVENIESGDGKSSRILLSTPGLSVFSLLVDGPIRAQASINGRYFVVAGQSFFEVFADGTFNLIGPVTWNDGLPAQIAVGPSALLIQSSGSVYSFILKTNAFALIAPANFTNIPVASVGFSDGFFLALLRNSIQVMISALEDPTTWPPTQFIAVSVFPDNVVSMFIDHREVWLFGLKATQVYATSGGPNIFDPIPGGYIEQGIGAALTPAKLDNSLFWIGGNDQGDRIGWRAQGYTPLRVTTHAVELAWQSYGKGDDAISYSYQDQGHSFWVVYFPNANKTWAYDAATGLWHERAFLDVAGFSAHRSQNHMFIFGKHLVGDWKTGNIFQMSIANFDDFGNPIRRVRRAPHISNENEYIYHHSLQIDMETGLGPQPPLRDGAGEIRDPQAFLRWSDDGGHTYGNEHALNCGQAGKFKRRAIKRQLGRSRDRVYELAVSDPIPWRIVDADLQATPGYAPQERLTTQLKKVS